MSTSGLDNLNELLSAFPSLPTLLVQAEHTLMARLYEMIDEDIILFEEDDPPNMTAMEEEYPALFSFITERTPFINLNSPSLVCQLAADLYSMAAKHFWEEMK